MFFIYSILLAIGFALMIPAFLIRREKYAAGFSQRLGSYPEFDRDGRKVIWLHCVSVGETNAARPLVDELAKEFPDHRLVISTTTKTGQDLAHEVFRDKADHVFYFPFDLRFAVRRALANFDPSIVLLMETEIWPRFIREAKLSGARVIIINGRLSERSFSRYARIRPFISRVLQDIALALMQGTNDANRLISLGMAAAKTVVTGNLKFDQADGSAETELTKEFRRRFDITPERPLIIAASTHEPEERWILEAWCSAMKNSTVRSRLMIVPRHPERFDAVFESIKRFREDPECDWREYTSARRSNADAAADRIADVILLDTIGELRDVYPLAEIVFVGGSLIPHGGQSVIEPAQAGKAIVTGPHTGNFRAAVDALLENSAIRQTRVVSQAFQNPERLYEEIVDLLEHPEKRRELGNNALAVVEASRGATDKTIKELRTLIAENLESGN